MGKSKSLQHVQLPNDMTNDTEVKPKDLLIYVCIKKFMNKDTKEAFPSQQTVADLAGVSRPTVKKSVDLLVKYGYMSIRKEGRKNIYKFNSYKNFEPFSYDFLEKEDLDSSEKALIVASQQKMYKDTEGYGKITMSDEDLADHLNVSTKTLTRVHKSLVKKGYLDLVKTNIKDPITGLYINEKLYHLNELEQAIVFTLQNHEDRLDKNETDIKNLQYQMDMILKENRELKKKFENKDIDDVVIDF